MKAIPIVLIKGGGGHLSKGERGTLPPNVFPGLVVSFWPGDLMKCDMVGHDHAALCRATILPIRFRLLSFSPSALHQIVTTCGTHKMTPLDQLPILKKPKPRPNQYFCVDSWSVLWYSWALVSLYIKWELNEIIYVMHLV